MIYYSVATNGFYINGIGEQNIPGDAVKITDELQQELLAGQEEGKIIIINENGMPALSDPVVDYVELADIQKTFLISQANDYMNSKQWPGKAAMGRLKDNETELYGVWLDYLDALEAVNTLSAPEIEWPTLPAQ
ncbi:tail fiber assembly protein [Dryocola sp. LX212]